MLIGMQLVQNGLKGDIKVILMKIFKIFLKNLVGNDIKFFFLPFAFLPADVQDFFYNLTGIIMRTPKPQLLINLKKCNDVKSTNDNEKHEKITKIDNYFTVNIN
jgi:hypothetical protein